MKNTMVRKWIVRKRYLCNILDEQCDDELHFMSDKGPDCKNCSIYIQWKKKLINK